MTPWTFTAMGREWRIGFGYDRIAGHPYTTTAWLYSRLSSAEKWHKEAWEGEAVLHPLDAGRFSYAEGRRLAVRRLIRTISLVELRPIVAQAFFQKG